MHLYDECIVHGDADAHADADADADIGETTCLPDLLWRGRHNNNLSIYTETTSFILWSIDSECGLQ